MKLICKNISIFIKYFCTRQFLSPSRLQKLINKNNLLFFLFGLLAIVFSFCKFHKICFVCSGTKIKLFEIFPELYIFHVGEFPRFRDCNFYKIIND